MFEKTVPEWVYRQKCDEYDRLFKAYEALRPTHGPVSPMRQTAPRPDSGTAALMGAELAVERPEVAQMADKFVTEGMSETQALREARRLYAIAKGKAVPTSAGEPNP